MWGYSQELNEVTEEAAILDSDPGAGRFEEARQHVQRLLWRYGPTSLLGISTLLAAVPGFFSLSSQTTWTILGVEIKFNAKVAIFVVAALLLAVGSFLTAIQSKSQIFWKGRYESTEEKLKKDKAERDDQKNTVKEMVVTISEMYSSLLRQLARECEMPEPHRVSLYDLADSTQFKLYGRYASDPKKSGLTADELLKPIEKGCLGRAWADGKASRVFSTHNSSYRREHRELGYSDAETEKLTMRPQAIFAMRFPQGSHDKYDGVLVVELQSDPVGTEFEALVESIEESATWSNITSAYKSLPTAIERSTSPAERGF